MWIYENEEFTEDKIGEYVGFVYLITEIETKKQYIGQKVFFNKVSKPPLKGKKNRRRSRKQSDWQQYWGSNEELRALVDSIGTDKFQREILRLCSSKAELNYFEAREIFVRDALLQPDKFFNNWCSTRIQRNQLKSLQR